MIGIEGRRHLIDHTVRTFQAKGVPDSQYRFIEGDAHERLFDPDVTGDVVLCLGSLYHTARYVELMAGIRSTGAEYVIVDTRVISVVPSQRAVRLMLRAAGYRLDHRTDWPALLAQHPDTKFVSQYETGKRA